MFACVISCGVPIWFQMIFRLHHFHLLNWIDNKYHLYFYLMFFIVGAYQKAFLANLLREQLPFIIGRFLQFCHLLRLRRYRLCHRSHYLLNQNLFDLDVVMLYQLQARIHCHLDEDCLIGRAFCAHSSQVLLSFVILVDNCCGKSRSERVLKCKSHLLHQRKRCDDWVQHLDP